MSALRKKRCKACKKSFVPTRPMQSTCCMDCAIEHSKKPKAQKAYRLEKKKELMEKYPDKSKLAVKMQRLANRYGRLRELARGNDFCVTCGARNVKFDGGHFLPTSQYRPIRYYTLQINPQCVNCNQYNGGRPKEYREYMIKRFGLEKVEWLEGHKQGEAKYTIEYYQRYLKIIGKRIKRHERKLDDIRV